MVTISNPRCLRYGNENEVEEIGAKDEENLELVGCQC